MKTNRASIAIALCFFIGSIFSAYSREIASNSFSKENNSFEKNTLGKNFSENNFVLKSGIHPPDDTKELQKLLDNGGTIVLEANKVYNVVSSLIITKDNSIIVGNNALIQFEYEQNNVSPAYSESLFIVNGRNNVEFRNIRMIYKGTYNINGSYEGMISGIYVTGSSNFIADGVEASYFNRAGINLGAGTSSYNSKPIVRNCYLHHNRVAGCVYGNNESGLIENNRFFYNGLLGDNGTGYGFTGWSASLPRNTTVIGNTANYNIRKGIDFHAGFNGSISNNVCNGNLITGIFVHGVIGNWTISNNQIVQMKTSSTTFQSITGMEIGNRDRNRNQDQAISFDIFKNKISSFTSDDGKSALPILIHVGSIGRGNIKITDNIFNCGNITGFILANTGGRTKSSRYYDIAINDNVFNADQTLSVPIYLRGTNNRKKTFIGNSITIKRGVKNVGYVIANDNSDNPDQALTVDKNKMLVPAKFYTSKTGDMIMRSTSDKKVKIN